MSRYRTVTRSSQNDAINVPAYRVCQFALALPSKDILSFLDVTSFDIEEEKNKLLFLREYKDEEKKRIHIEELFAGIGVVIDDKVYLVGASLKDLGKKWFAVALLESIAPEELIARVAVGR